MKNITKFLFLLVFCAAIVAGCKKEEGSVEKTPAERLAGRYTVYDTLFYEEMSGMCDGGVNETKEYTTDIRALTNKRVAFNQIVGSDEGTGDIYSSEIKLVLPHTPVTKIAAYQDGKNIRIYYNWNAPCWPTGRAVMVKRE